MKIKLSALLYVAVVTFLACGAYADSLKLADGGEVKGTFEEILFKFGEDEKETTVGLADIAKIELAEAGDKLFLANGEERPGKLVSVKIKSLAGSLSFTREQLSEVVVSAHDRLELRKTERPPVKEEEPKKAKEPAEPAKKTYDKEAAFAKNAELYHAAVKTVYAEAEKQRQIIDRESAQEKKELENKIEKLEKEIDKLSKQVLKPKKVQEAGPNSRIQKEEKEKEAARERERRKAQDELSKAKKELNELSSLAQARKAQIAKALMQAESRAKAAFTTHERRIKEGEEISEEEMRRNYLSAIQVFWAQSASKEKSSKR